MKGGNMKRKTDKVFQEKLGRETEESHTCHKVALTIEDSLVTPQPGSGRIKTDPGTCPKVF